MLENIQNLTDAYNFFIENWWQVLLALIIAITVIWMIIKYILQNVIMFAALGIMYILFIPFRIVARFPKTSLLLIFGAMIYFFMLR
ncbi:MAG: hypothetical protein AB7E61_06070 [Acholeplasmataceae bacterium]